MSPIVAILRNQTMFYCPVQGVHDDHAHWGMFTAIVLEVLGTHFLFYTLHKGFNEVPDVLLR